MRWLPVLSALVLMLAPGGVAFAADSPSPATELKVQPEAVPEGPELAALLFGETPPLMSVAPKASEAASARDPFEDWWHGICWTSCSYCRSHSDCPQGESCQFGVQCP
jgi:hypothetical protein